MSHHVTSCHSCHVMPRHATSCHTMSHHVTPCHVTSCHALSRHVTLCNAMSRHVTSCHVTSCHVMSRHVTSCHVLSRLATLCHIMPRHFMSRRVTLCHVLSRPVTSCHVGCPEGCRFHTASAVYHLVSNCDNSCFANVFQLFDFNLTRFNFLRFICFYLSFIFIFPPSFRSIQLNKIVYIKFHTNHLIYTVMDFFNIL